MDSFEMRIARALMSTQPRDEAFVQKVALGIGSKDKRRKAGLAIATLIVGFLTSGLFYGIVQAWTAWSVIAGLV